LRHAKSSWKHAELDDHDRPLNKRGRQAAEALAQQLRAGKVRPDLVLCSTALRARQTLDPLALKLRPRKMILDRALYAAAPDELLKYLRRTSDEVREILLIAHNPALHELALLLADDASAGRLPGLDGKFPTAALASFTLRGNWTALRPQGAHLAAYLLPPPSLGRRLSGAT
jgi:phosphohistidine phosphatase